MAEKIHYQKTLGDIIKDYLASNLPQGFFKKIIYGGKFTIPTSIMPCITVSKAETKITAGPTGMDKITTNMIINIIYNARDDIGGPLDEVMGKRSLEQMAEGIDPDTNQYSEISIMGILRKYFTLSTPQNGYTVLNQEHTITYFDGVPRPEKNWTVEALIRTSYEQLRKVSARQ